MILKIKSLTFRDQITTFFDSYVQTGKISYVQSMETEAITVTGGFLSRINEKLHCLRQTRHKSWKAINWHGCTRRQHIILTRECKLQQDDLCKLIHFCKCMLWSLVSLVFKLNVKCLADSLWQGVAVTQLYFARISIQLFWHEEKKAAYLKN